MCADGVFSLVAPAIWRAHVTCAFDSATATGPESFVVCGSCTSPTDPLYLCAVVVMGYEAGVVCVFDVEEAFMATETVQTGWRG